MTVDEAIKLRIERFNKLYLKDTGHSFEDDPQWCKEQNEMEEKRFNEAIKPVLDKYNFKSYEEYHNKLEYNYETHLWENTIEEIDNTSKKLNKKTYSSLYGYEMYVINDAKRTYNFIIDNMPQNWWIQFVPGKSCSDVETELKKYGYVTDNGHSGNTFYQMIVFTDCLFRNIENFPYLHGALSPLVGDEGYHDDRSDIPKKKTK